MRRSVSYAVLMAAICLVWAAIPIPAAAQGISDLRCENAANPRGVGTSHPRFSWKYGTPERGQAAYRILVASSEEKLKAGKADLWDSGIVLSDQETAEYQGRPLSSFRRYYWSIRVWGIFHEPTPYSAPATWETGLLTFHGEKSR
jgi:alpha-L-rhamnosidase